MGEKLVKTSRELWVIVWYCVIMIRLPPCFSLHIYFDSVHMKCYTLSIIFFPDESTANLWGFNPMSRVLHISLNTCTHHQLWPEQLRHKQAETQSTSFRKRRRQRIWSVSLKRTNTEKLLMIMEGVKVWRRKLGQRVTVNLQKKDSLGGSLVWICWTREKKGSYIH